jgi:hypothetical protein
MNPPIIKNSKMKIKNFLSKIKEAFIKPHGQIGKPDSSAIFRLRSRQNDNPLRNFLSILKIYQIKLPLASFSLGPYKNTGYVWSPASGR